MSKLHYLLSMIQNRSKTHIGIYTNEFQLYNAYIAATKEYGLTNNNFECCMFVKQQDNLIDNQITLHGDDLEHILDHKRVIENDNILPIGNNQIDSLICAIDLDYFFNYGTNYLSSKLNYSEMMANIELEVLCQLKKCILLLKKNDKLDYDNHIRLAIKWLLLMQTDSRFSEHKGKINEDVSNLYELFYASKTINSDKMIRILKTFTSWIAVAE